MKLAAAILGIIILFTSAFPVPVKLVSVTNPIPKCHYLTEHCKKIIQQPKVPKKEKEFNSGGCSPFSICNYFPVVPPVFPVLKEAGFIIFDSSFDLYNEMLYSGYDRKCWHPPKPSWT